MASHAALIIAALALALGACGTDPVEGKLTDSTCPTIDKPTYDNFGKAFFEGYCTACHSETKVDDERNGAPPTIDFDTVALIRENTSRIDKQAAFGATIMNRLMPEPSRAMELELPLPSDDERFRLGEYMACIVGR